MFAGLTPPGAYVVRQAEAAEATVDWSSWYLTDGEDLGQSGEQRANIKAFDSSLDVLAAERGWSGVHIGSDQFFAWRRDEPLVRVSPDVYLLDDPPERPFPAVGRPGSPAIGHRAWRSRSSRKSGRRTTTTTLIGVREGDAATLRLARDEAGADLVPTVREANERERQARVTAEGRVRALEAELAALRRGSADDC